MALNRSAPTARSALASRPGGLDLASPHGGRFSTGYARCPPPGGDGRAAPQLAFSSPCPVPWRSVPRLRWLDRSRGCAFASRRSSRCLALSGGTGLLLRPPLSSRSDGARRLARFAGQTFLTPPSSPSSAAPGRDLSDPPFTSLRSTPAALVPRGTGQGIGSASRPLISAACGFGDEPWARRSPVPSRPLSSSVSPVGAAVPASGEAALCSRRDAPVQALDTG